MPSNKRLLVALGMVPPLANELGNQIDGLRPKSGPRLSAESAPGPLARELVRQMNAGIGNRDMLSQLGMPSRLAREVSNQIGSSPPTPTPARNLLLHMDLDSDGDDISDLLEAIYDHKSGAYNLIAVTIDTLSDGPVALARVMLDAHGLFDIPVGVYQGTGAGIVDGLDDNSVSEERGFNSTPARFGHNLKTRASWPSALTVIRTVLAAAPDNSVYIHTTGSVTSLRLLLESAGDGISPLTGMQLATQKVVWLGLNASGFTESTTKYADFQKDFASGVYVAENWPTVSNEIGLMDSRQGISTVRVNYPNTIVINGIEPGDWNYRIVVPFFGPSYNWEQGRPPFASCGMLYVKGGTAFSANLAFSERGNGVWSQSSPFQQFVPNPSGRHRRLLLTTDPATYQAQVQATLNAAGTQWLNYFNDTGWRSKFYNRRRYRLRDVSSGAVADTSGNGYSLTVTGTTAGTYGRVFNGTSDCMIESTANCDLQGSPVRTVHAVIIPSAVTGASRVFQARTAGTAPVYQFGINTSGMLFWTDRSGTMITASSGALSAGTAYHVSVHIDANLAVTLRVGATTVGTGTLPSVTPLGTAPGVLNVGCRTNATSAQVDFFAGEIVLCREYIVPNAKFPDIRAEIVAECAALPTPLVV